MAHYKVEICGINTSKLPLLSNEEKKTLFDKIKKGDKKARETYHPRQSPSFVLASSKGL